MGFVQQSNVKKIYAYLTQDGKGKIITGTPKDFQVAYFSLHDDDVNYYTSSKMSGTNYNLLPSGFIPDITGDDNACLPNISDATNLERNKLIGIIEPPPPVIIPNQPLTGTAVGINTTDGTYRFEINVSNVKGGTGSGYYWNVKTEVLSQEQSSTGDFVTNSFTVLSTSLSDDYQVGTPQRFDGTFTFEGNGYLPRKADSYRFTVYIGDSSGQMSEVEIAKFEDINCSKRQYGWVVFSEIVDNYVNPQLISDTTIDNIPAPSAERYPLAVFVIDNGNRRRDLNITQNDLTLLGAVSNGVGFLNFKYKQDCCPTPYQNSSAGITITFGGSRNVEQTTGLFSETSVINGQYYKNDTQAWNDNFAYAVVPSSIRNSGSYQMYTGNFDTLHPTIISNSPLKVGFMEMIGKCNPNDFGSYAPGKAYTLVHSYYEPMSESSSPNLIYNPTNKIGVTFAYYGSYFQGLQPMEFSWYNYC